MPFDERILLGYGLNEKEAQEIMACHRAEVENEMAAWRHEHAVPPFMPEGQFFEPVLTPQAVKNMSSDEINSRWGAVKDMLMRAGRRK